MKRLAKDRRPAPILFLLSVMSCGFAQADPIADFYSRHTVTIIVGSDPGGTYDLYARTIARHLGRHIPGSPRVIVENMPGAGGYNAALNVMNVAPEDGATIGAIGSSSLPFQPLMDPNAPKLDVSHINWLGSASSYNIMMLVRADVPVYSVDDLRKRQTIMATIAPGQLNSVIVAATNAALGTKIKGVNGHLGMPAAMLALERGEIDGYPSAPVDALKRTYAKQLAQGKLRLLIQFGPAPLPEFPTVPYGPDLATTPADRLLLELAQGPLSVGYGYMAGPAVPPDRLAALRAGFSATLDDPDFRADAKQEVLDVKPVSGPQIQAQLDKAYRSPPAVLKRIREIYGSLTR